MINFYDVFTTVALRELIESIENNNKSIIESVEVFCEVNEYSAKFYLEFELRNEDTGAVCVRTIEGENLSPDDPRVVLPYNDFVCECNRVLSNEYNIECQSLGIYYN